MTYRADFEYLKLNSDFAKDPKGPYTVEVFDGRGLGSLNAYWKACLIPTRQKFGGRGYGSALAMQNAVNNMFQKRVSDWREVKE